jgi:hypothetical protein
MKTLRFLFAVLVVACFSVGTANSQVDRVVDSGVWHFESVDMGGYCIGEPVTGDLNYCFCSMLGSDGVHLNFLIVRVHGTLIGDVTGDAYIINEIDQNHGVGNQHAGMFSFNAHWNVTREGQGLIGVAYTLIHGTANDATWNKKEGNFASWVELVRYECQ